MTPRLAPPRLPSVTPSGPTRGSSSVSPPAPPGRRGTPQRRRHERHEAHLPHARSARNAGAVRIRGRSRANGPRVGASPEYVVDGRGRRVAKKVDGVTTKRWLYRDQLNPVAELDGAGVLTWQYVYGSKPNVPDYAIRVADGARYRIVSDQLGSVVLVVNVADATDVLFAGRYDAFGEQEVLVGSAEVVPFGFAGGRYDPETGLVRFGARDYDPGTGRWTARDAVWWAGGQANLFVYAYADAINYVDHSGRAAVVFNAVPAIIFVAALATTGAYWVWSNQDEDDDLKDLLDDLYDKFFKPTPPPQKCKIRREECIEECRKYLFEPYPSGSGTCGSDLGGAHGFQRCIADCEARKAQEDGC